MTIKNFWVFQKFKKFIDNLKKTFIFLTNFK